MTATLMIVIIFLLLVLAGVAIMQQGTVAVITIFGKYRDILRLSFRMPFIEKKFGSILIKTVP